MDLYLNGNYAGLYLLSERNEVESQRVDIGETDSFLLSMEFEDRWNGTNYPAFLSMHGNLLRIHHAGMPADWAREVWQSAEDAIFSEDGVDPRTGKGWEDLINTNPGHSNTSCGRYLRSMMPGQSANSSIMTLRPGKYSRGLSGIWTIF